MKHEPKIVEHDRLLSIAAEQRDGIDSFPELEGRDYGEGSFWILQWPDHCVTEQHLGDAAIHGPFATREEAEACL